MIGSRTSLICTVSMLKLSFHTSLGAESDAPGPGAYSPKMMAKIHNATAVFGKPTDYACLP